MVTDTVLSENCDGVLVVTLNRPEKKNAIDNAGWRAIRDVFEEALANDGVACVLLTGAGGFPGEAGGGFP